MSSRLPPKVCVAREGDGRTVKRRTPNPAPDEIAKIAHAKREGARRFHIGQEQMLHTQAGYISADCFHHFRIPACSPAADHTSGHVIRECCITDLDRTPD